MRHKHHSSHISTGSHSPVSYWPVVLLSVARQYIWSQTSTRELRHRLAARVLTITALVVQLALTAVCLYLVDLALDLADLWILMARKHLELTL